MQPTFTISLEKKFCDYFSQDLPSKTRKNLRMYTNRIRREGSVKFLHYAGRGAEEQFPRFLDIEDSGWKGAGGSSIKKCAAEYESYYRHFIQLLADQEALHFYFLEYDGKIIAGILGYTDVDVFHCFKVAYDEQYRTLSPSNLLLMHMVEHLMTSSPRTKRLHLFPWDGGYKHRFTNEKAWCVETMLFSPTLRGKLVELCYRMGKAAKKLPGAVSFINSWRRERAGEG